MKIGRRSLLFGALVVTLIMALWPLPEPAPQSEDGATATRKRSAAAPAGKQPLTLADLSLPHSAKEPAAGDLFPRQTWTPPPGANEARPESPQPPALPFVYGGRYTESGKIMAFLTEGTAVYTVSQGETLKDAYRVDEIGEDNITLTYLPLGLQQKLPAPTLQR